MLRRVQREREALYVRDDVLEGVEAVGICTDVQLEIGNRLGSDPARAKLGTGELLAIEHRNAAPALDELARTCGARWSTAHGSFPSA